MSVLQIILTVSLISLPALGNTSLETKKNTKILAEPNSNADSLMEVKKGELLESSGRQGMFWKVKVSGKDGYISVMAVNRQVTDKQELSDVIRTAARDSREEGDNASIRSRSAVMGVRGLDESDQIASVGNIKPDLRAVYRMEDRSPMSSKELQGYESKINREIEKTMERNQQN